MESNRTLCFAADASLGKLARWLRILGFDTLFDPKTPFGEFIEHGKRRILLTRTERIRGKNTSHKLIFITSNNPYEQLREVVQDLGLVPEDLRIFSRCIRCNVSVKPVDKGSIRHSVPDYVWETHDTFRICDQCRRIYWAGSHAAQSRAIMNRIFAWENKSDSM
ncbi:Mut7-C RNAse domain-containing protein [Thermodesulfobacteriota bacterium]